MAAPRHGSATGRLLIVTHSGPIRLLRAAQSRTPLSSLLSIEVPYAALIAVAPDPDARSSPPQKESS